jgi:hypothetical protein
MVRNIPPTLKERAERVWQEERPKCAVRISKRAHEINELRRKIEDIFGSGLYLDIQVESCGRPVAVIENLRFALASCGRRNRRSLMLIYPCTRCLAEAGSIINSLAELGQLLHYFATVGCSSCSECIGLTDSELIPLRIAVNGQQS